MLVELASKDGFSPVGAAHFNHGLRGEASDEDERFCEALAGRLGLAWNRGGGDVRGFAAATGASIEDACRRFRYAHLRRAAVEAGATHVAVGHTRDDQAETVLLHLLRGAGPRGLRAMMPSRPLAEAPAAPNASPAPGVLLIRPLLDVSHADLTGWLDSRGVPFRIDESNTDRRFLRNRVRHEVIPLLEARVSPSISRVLARDAAIAASDAEYLDGLAREAFARMASVGSGRVELDRAKLCAEPDPVRRRVALLAIERLAAHRFAGFDQGERVVALAAGRLRGPLALPGAVAAATREKVVLVAAPHARPQRWPDGQAPGPEHDAWRLPLPVPGEVTLPGGNRFVSSDIRRLVDPGEWRLVASGPDRAAVDAGSVSGLSVRARRPGDRLRPVGLGGRKKLQDYFVDRKVPRAERDRVPLVVDGRDRIVWVAGHGIDEEFRVGGEYARRGNLAGEGRRRLNSTLKSLLFWMVLVVVGVLIWNFSDELQPAGQRHDLHRVHAEGGLGPGGLA